MKITVRDLSVRYGAHEALAGVSFDVSPGAVFAVVGRNGAGKSTLVRALLGQRRPDAGEIRIDGADPWRERARVVARVGATPESADAPGERTQVALARWCAPLYPGWDQTAFRARLERFAIDPARRIGELSRGQRALVHLALALAPRPDLLVLDDPTQGLDAVARRFVFDELIGELAERGVTVVLTSHDLEGVERVATDVGILERGRLAACGPLDELRAGAARAGLAPPTLEEILLAAAAGEEAR